MSRALKRPDLFLSYNHADRPWAQKLARDLENRNLSLFFDEWNIRPGENIAWAINEALELSSFVAFVMSPSSLKSEWVKMEIAIAASRDPAAAKGTLIPLYRHECDDIPPMLTIRKWIDFRREDEYANSLALLVATVKGEPLPRGEQVSVSTEVIENIRSIDSQGGVDTRILGREKQECCVVTDPELPVRLFDYISAAKVSQLYYQLVLRLLRKGISLGQLVNYLGLDLSYLEALRAAKIDEIKATQNLSIVGEFEVVWRILVHEGLLKNLNLYLTKGQKIQNGDLVAFEGEATFALQDQGRKITDPRTIIIVRGDIEDYRFAFACSVGNFVGGGSGLEIDIAERIRRKIRGLALVKRIELQEKGILLNPISFW